MQTPSDTLALLSVFGLFLGGTREVSNRGLGSLGVQGFSLLSGLTYRESGREREGFSLKAFRGFWGFHQKVFQCKLAVRLRSCSLRDAYESVEVTTCCGHFCSRLLRHV